MLRDHNSALRGERAPDPTPNSRNNSIERAAKLRKPAASIIASALLLVSGCEVRQQVVELSCDDLSGYCATSVRLDEPSFASTLSFDEQPQSIGFWVTGEGLGIYHLAASDGPEIFSEYQLYETDWIYGTGRPQIWFTLPFSSDDGELARDYELQLGGQRIEDVQVWHRYARSFADDAHVDVHLVFDPSIDAPVPRETVGEALGLWGLELGRLNVSRVDLPSDPDEIVTALWAPAPTTRVPTLTVLALNELDSGGGFARLGPPTSGHAFVAFVASAGDDTSEVAAEDSRVLAHEIGHLAGLFHTSDLVAPDFLDDTPPCDSENFEQDRFSCPDANNVMSTTGLGTEVSEQQRALVHKALFVAPPLLPDFADTPFDASEGSGLMQLTNCFQVDGSR